MEFGKDEKRHHERHDDEPVLAGAGQVGDGGVPAEHHVGAIPSLHHLGEAPRFTLLPAIRCWNHSYCLNYTFHKVHEAPPFEVDWRVVPHVEAAIDKTENEQNGGAKLQKVGQVFAD